jgi:hypothetical protein
MSDWNQQSMWWTQHRHSTSTETYQNISRLLPRQSQKKSFRRGVLAQARQPRWWYLANRRLPVLPSNKSTDKQPPTLLQDGPYLEQRGGPAGMYYPLWSPLWVTAHVWVREGCHHLLPSGGQLSGVVGSTATDAYGPLPWRQITELVNQQVGPPSHCNALTQAHLSQVHQHWLSSTSRSPPSSNTHRAFHQAIGLCSMKNEQPDDRIPRESRWHQCRGAKFSPRIISRGKCEVR